MTPADITVHRLRLPPAAPGLAWRVEDALRVSSKPASLQHRHVLVRRLRLRAAAGASAQTLATQLEQAWREIAARAEPIELASSDAEAVWTPSAAAARQALLRRWLRGEPAEAWFWQDLAPGQQTLPWPQRALALMRMAHEEAAASASVAAAGRQQPFAHVQALLAVISAHQASAAFIDALSPPEAAELLRLADAPAREASHPGETPARQVGAAQQRLVDLMTQAPMRSHSLAASSERRAAPLLASRLQATASAITPQLDGPTLTRPNHATPAAKASTRPRQLIAEPPTKTAHGLASPWSGLWLLLPLLLRHGLDDADDPLAAWAGAMQAACLRFRIPADDPVQIAAFELAPPITDDTWLRTARLAAVHDAGLPLLRIARRSGSAWVSPERIDVEFPAAALDLRIRRAGFDINPGFVLWLGRIVHFHYPT